LPNEERLVEKARSTGFEVVYPEKMSLAEQIMIFEEAKVICATHGAGMANLVWAKKCRSIFEIYNDNFQTETYRMLAKRLNIAYSRVHYLDALDAHDIWID
jgi:capsular polysaccharide biosynthesis protein